MNKKLLIKLNNIDFNQIKIFIDINLLLTEIY